VEKQTTAGKLGAAPKRVLKNSLRTDAQNEDFSLYINNLTCSDEIKVGEHDMEKVAMIASMRLKSISKDNEKNLVHSREDVNRVNFSKKPNFLVQKLF